MHGRRRDAAAPFQALPQSWYKPGRSEAAPIIPNARRRDVYDKPGRGMKPGFYTIMAAQFFSSLADNALLIAAIALLQELQEPDWMRRRCSSRSSSSTSILAPVVGAFADSMPKGRVMLITNAIKVVGCVLMMFTVHPLLAYAVVGLGAAAYSPAKYGILTELLPPQQLVVANGWIEGTTVGSIILGVLLGGVLVSPKVSTMLLGFDLPVIDTGHRHAARGRDRRDRGPLRDRRDLQLVHPRHRRRPPDRRAATRSS